MGFKAGKKLISRKRECSARVGRSRDGDCSGVVCVRSEGSLRFIGREFPISGERSCGMNDLQTGAWRKQVEGKDTDDLRNEFCQEV